MSRAALLRAPLWPSIDISITQSTAPRVFRPNARKSGSRPHSSQTVARGDESLRGIALLEAISNERSNAAKPSRRRSQVLVHGTSITPGTAPVERKIDGITPIITRVSESEGQQSKGGLLGERDRSKLKVHGESALISVIGETRSVEQRSSELHGHKRPDTGGKSQQVAHHAPNQSESTRPSTRGEDEQCFNASRRCLFKSTPFRRGRRVQPRHDLDKTFLPRLTRARPIAPAAIPKQIAANLEASKLLLPGSLAFAMGWKSSSPVPVHCSRKVRRLSPTSQSQSQSTPMFHPCLIPAYRSVIQQEFMLWGRAHDRKDSKYIERPNWSNWSKTKKERQHTLQDRTAPLPIVSSTTRRRFHKLALIFRSWNDNWTKTFSEINSRFNDTVPYRYKCGRFPLSGVLDVRLHKALRRRQKAKDVVELLQSCKGVRPEFWRQIMLHVLHRHPNHGLEAIMATVRHTGHALEPYMLADAFEYVVSHTLRGLAGNEGLVGVSHKLFTALIALDHRVPYFLQSLQPKALALMLRQSTIRQAKVIMETCLRREIHFGPLLTSLVAWKFGKHKSTDFARGMLASVPEKAWTIQGSTLLKAATTTVRNARFPLEHSDELQTLHDLEGISAHRLDQSVYESAAFQAASRGRLDAVLQIVALMHQRGANVSGRMAAAIVNACKHPRVSQDVSTILKTNMNKAITLRDPILATAILDVRLFTLLEYMRGGRNSGRVGSAAYEELVRLYLLFFDPEPMVQLSLIPASISGYRDSTSPSITPNHITLGTMLRAFVYWNANPDTMLALYHRYKELVSNKHAAILNSVQTTFAHDVLIRGLGKFRSTVSLCAIVLQDMETRRPIYLPRDQVANFQFLHCGKDGAKRFEEIKRTRMIVPARPGTHTFNALIQAYQRFDMAPEVRSAWNLMQTRKSEAPPTCETFTSLLRSERLFMAPLGARRAAVENVVEEMGRLGIQPDGRFDALAKRITRQRATRKRDS